jgi:hypothetical protein
VPRKGNAPPRIPECHPDQPHLAKGLCKKCYDTAYRLANRDKTNTKAREWSRANPQWLNKGEDILREILRNSHPMTAPYVAAHKYFHNGEARPWAP